jgi:hypothetical protein
MREFPAMKRSDAMAAARIRFDASDRLLGAAGGFVEFETDLASARLRELYQGTLAEGIKPEERALLDRLN